MCAAWWCSSASAFPRIALVTDVDLRATGWTSRSSGWALPLLGLIFLPYTTFFYVLAYAPIVGVGGIGWLFVIFGFFLDLSSYFGGGRYSSQQYATRT